MNTRQKYDCPSLNASYACNLTLSQLASEDTAFGCRALSGEEYVQMHLHPKLFLHNYALKFACTGTLTVGRSLLL